MKRKTKVGLIPVESNPTVIWVILPLPTLNTICLLDDDPSVLCGVGRLLKSAGWHTEKFDDPEKFLCYAKTHRIPVAVTDIWMPLMSGLEVQAQLRTLSPSTRVIVFTANRIHCCAPLR